MNDIRQLLKKLHEAKCAVDLVTLERDKLIDDVLSAEQRNAIRDIREEYQDRLDAALKIVEELDQQTRAAVHEHGESVKTDRMHAIYTRPAPSWDSDGLLAMSKNPEFAWLREFMKTGEPRIQIRANKS